MNRHIKKNCLELKKRNSFNCHNDKKNLPKYSDGKTRCIIFTLHGLYICIYIIVVYIAIAYNVVYKL